MNQNKEDIMNAIKSIIEKRKTINNEYSEMHDVNITQNKNIDGTGSFSLGVKQIKENIMSAEQYAFIGAEVPQFYRYSGFKRKLAKKVAKLLLYLLQIITKPQRNYNNMVIQSLNMVADRFDAIERLLLTEVHDIERNKSLFHSQEVLRSQLLELKKNLSIKENISKKIPENDMENKPVHGKNYENMSLAQNNDLNLDAMYLSFENLFRGPRETIKEKQRYYLPIIKKAIAEIKKPSILDIGCGRGEWLELLIENGFQAKGIDSNNFMVQLCKEHGLNVEEYDAINYLMSAKSESYNVITGFHLIEHFSFSNLIKFIDEVFRTLVPGGVAIFETPNPENIVVSSLSFYRDPSHINPLVPDTMKFVFEQRGFHNVEINRLHKRNDVEPVGNRLMDEILTMANMEMDYAVIGYK